MSADATIAYMTLTCHAALLGRPHYVLKFDCLVGLRAFNSRMESRDKFKFGRLSSHDDRK